MLSKMPFNSLFLPHARDQTNNISPHFVTEFRTDHVNFWHVSNRGHCRNLICTFFFITGSNYRSYFNNKLQDVQL